MQQIFMYMTNMLEAVDIEVMKFGLGGMFKGGLSAWFTSLLYGLLTLVCKVLGIIADLMNVAFYIFSGIDIAGADGQGMYEISVGGEKQNILDYFVLSETVTKAYLWLALGSVLLIVIFTIYKIVKQDYFDRAGPRSKGPIFRNVAISCISFLLVIPIFWLIIHASSLLAVVVMDLMGFDASELAGAKVFTLSWSDADAPAELGQVITYINEIFKDGKADRPYTLNQMYSLDDRTLFVLFADRKYLDFATNIDIGEFKSIYTKVPAEQSLAQYGVMIGETSRSVEFYWYIYIIGVIITIKSLYKMLLAMLQRIFKLMGLFLVAPSPISQYVLDDGQKFKTWLQESIQEGLRLVSATMSFSIYLFILSLVGRIKFTDAFDAALGGQATVIPNVSLLSNTGVEGVVNLPMAAETANTNNFFASLANAFLKIFMLIGAGGAITDLDQVLTPLISGGKSSLDAGQTGASAGALVSGTMSVAGAVGGAVMGKFTQGLKNINARKDGQDAGREEAEKDGAVKPDDGGTPPGGKDTEGSGSGDSSKDENGVNTPTDGKNPENVGDDSGDNQKDGDEGSKGPEGEEGKEKKDGEENTEGGSGDKENSDGKDNGAPEEGKHSKPIGKLFNTLGRGLSWAYKGPAIALKSTGKSIKKGVNWLGEKGKDIQNKKRKTILGGAMAEIGGGLMRGVGGALKLAGKVGLGALKVAGTAAGAAGAGLKAGFKAAKGAIGTAIFGKDVAKSYADARNGAIAEENKAAAKRYESGKQQGYARRRQEQLKEAEENVNKKQGEVNNSTDDLNKAVEEEKVAAGQVETAQGQAATDGLLAEEANNKVGEKAGTAKTKADMAEYEGVKQMAASQNKDIEAEHGNRQQIMDKLNLARKSGDKKEEARYKAVLDQYDHNRETIKQANQEIAAGQAKLDAIDTVTGKNGKMERLLGTSDFKNQTEFNKAINKKLNDETISDKEREELKEMQSQVMNVGKDVFNSEEAKTARGANTTARQSQQALQVAQSNYNEKHENTVSKRGVVQSKLKELNNATNVVNTLNTATDNSGYSNGNRTPGGIGKDGNYSAGTRKGIGQQIRAKNMRNRRNEAQKVIDGAGNSTVTATNAISSSDVSVNTPKSVTEVLDNYKKSNDEQVANSEKVRDTNILAAASKFKGQTVSYTVQGNNKPQKMDLGRFINGDGSLDIQELNKFRNESGQSFVGNDAKKLDDMIKEYTGTVNSENNKHEDVVKSVAASNDRITTAKNVAQVMTNSISTEHDVLTNNVESNVKQATRVSNQINTLNDIIDSGGKAPLTKANMDLINRVNEQLPIGKAPRLNETSKPEDVVQAARAAKELKGNELDSIIKDSEKLTLQADELASSLTDAINSALQTAGIKVNVDNNGQDSNGNKTGKGNDKSEGVSGPGVNSNITNINNNTNVIDGGNTSNELPASSGLAQSKDLNAYYERIQVEGIKHMQVMLDTMRIRNEQMKDDLEIIKREVSNDHK